MMEYLSNILSEKELKTKIIFFIDDRNDNKSFLKNNLKEEIINKKTYEFPLYLFSFKCNSYQEKLLKDLVFKEFEFFIIPEKDSENFIKNIFNNIKNVKYISNNITVTSNYSIINIFSKSINFQNDPNKNFTFSKLYLIPGKEYKYVFNLNLTDIRNGEIILHVNIDYIHLIRKDGHSSKILKYYNFINYFDFNKKEYCRAILLKEIDNNS